MPNSADGIVWVSVAVPIDLRERARRIGKRKRISTTYMLLEGLRRVLVELEEGERKERDTREADWRRNHLIRDEKAHEKRLRETRPLEPFDEDETVETEEKRPAPNPGLVDVYEKHGALIFEAMAKAPHQVDERINEAVKAVKAMAPLTHPSVQEILDQLDAVVSSRAAKAASIKKSFEVTSSAEPAQPPSYEQYYGRIPR